MVTDTIADMLTRIRNSNQIHQGEVEIPFSKPNLQIGRVLKEQGYINDYSVESAGKFEMIKVNLKYVDGQRAITGLKRISKPGLRVYAKSEKIKPVLGGLGVAIVSTSKGMLSDKEAREKNIGGEVIAYVW
ncbi:MAG: 30S ribosomal protein S8 [Actinobacteria bacterium]|nr:MAG: 30S ribosomal protein S8 [Actinomycetota bacterium]